MIAGAGLIPLWEMSLEELEVARALAVEYERGLLVTLFGEEGATRYRRLERSSESVYDRERADDAFAELERMQGRLTERESKLLFGIDEEDCVPTVDEVRDYIRALSALDYSSPANLGDSLKYALIKLGGRDDPETMTEGQRHGYAQVRAAADYAGSAGWDFREVLWAAREGLRALYDDPQDGGMMSERATAMMRQAEEAGSWYYAVTTNSKSLTLAP
jgi:hypothetical protein